MLGEATVVAIVPESRQVCTSPISMPARLTTVKAKAVIMGVPKYISSRLITEISAEQKNRHAPHPLRAIPGRQRDF